MDITLGIDAVVLFCLVVMCISAVFNILVIIKLFSFIRENSYLVDRIDYLINWSRELTNYSNHIDNRLKGIELMIERYRARNK